MFFHPKLICMSFMFCWSTNAIATSIIVTRAYKEDFVIGLDFDKCRKSVGLFNNKAKRCTCLGRAVSAVYISLHDYDKAACHYIFKSMLIRYIPCPDQTLCHFDVNIGSIRDPQCSSSMRLEKIRVWNAVQNEKENWIGRWELLTESHHFQLNASMEYINVRELDSNVWRGQLVLIESTCFSLNELGSRMQLMLRIEGTCVYPFDVTRLYERKKIKNKSENVSDSVKVDVFTWQTDHTLGILILLVVITLFAICSTCICYCKQRVHNSS